VFLNFGYTQLVFAHTHEKPQIGGRSSYIYYSTCFSSSSSEAEFSEELDEEPSLEEDLLDFLTELLELPFLDEDFFSRFELFLDFFLGFCFSE